VDGGRGDRAQGGLRRGPVPLRALVPPPAAFSPHLQELQPSFEFLSSDIETLIEEVAAARGFSPRQSVLQIYGTCDACRTGPAADGRRGATTELLFARDALRIAIATERSGLEFYSRAAKLTRDARGRRVFEKLAEEEKEHLGTLEARYRELLQQDPQLESRPTFLFFKGAANGLFAAGADQLAKGVDDRQALMIGIRCERGSHRFFKRYGERFEDSEGKRIFLEFADEERAHLELLIREYRNLLERQRRRRRRGPGPHLRRWHRDHRRRSRQGRPPARLFLRPG
jgi:rubrerythrin